MMNISDKIQILRHDKEWSQDDLAEKLNVSRQSVSKWESGKALPDSEKVLAMARTFLCFYAISFFIFSTLFTPSS